MNKYLLSLIVIFTCIAFTIPSLAQVRLPQASPDAFVQQTIGLTDVSVRYHAPSVRGRKVFGSLVPYSKLWRAGANEATLITFSDDLFLNNERVPAGTYSFFIIPESNRDWSIVLNKDTTLWGLEGYSELNDVAYLSVKPKNVPFQETLQFSFSNIGTNTGYLHLTWENTQLSLLVETEVEKKAMANIKKALAEARPDDWYIWAQCAEYLMQKKDYHEQALKWVNKSIAIKENFYNSWIKARLYAYNQEYQEAAAITAKAMQLGHSEPDAYKTYAKEIESAYNDWKKRKF